MVNFGGEHFGKRAVVKHPLTEMLDKLVSELDIEAGTIEALQNAKIQTVGDLVALTREELIGRVHGIAGHLVDTQIMPAIEKIGLPALIKMYNSNRS